MTEIAVLGFVVLMVVVVFGSLMVATARRADRAYEARHATSPEADRLAALSRVYATKEPTEIPPPAFWVHPDEMDD